MKGVITPSAGEQVGRGTLSHPARGDINESAF